MRLPGATAAPRYTLRDPALCAQGMKEALQAEQMNNYGRMQKKYTSPQDESAPRPAKTIPKRAHNAVSDGDSGDDDPVVPKRRPSSSKIAQSDAEDDLVDEFIPNAEDCDNEMDTSDNLFDEGVPEPEGPPIHISAVKKKNLKREANNDMLANPDFVDVVDEQVSGPSTKRRKIAGHTPKHKVIDQSPKDPHEKANLLLWHRTLFQELLIKGKFWASSQDTRDLIFDLVERGDLPDEAFEIHRRHSSWVSDHGKEVRALLNNKFRLHPLAAGGQAKYDQSSKDAAQKLMSNMKAFMFKDGCTDCTKENREERYLGTLQHAAVAVTFGKTFPCPAWDEHDYSFPQLGWGLLGVALSSIFWHLTNVAEGKNIAYGATLTTIAAQHASLGLALPEALQEIVMGKLWSAGEAKGSVFEGIVELDEAGIDALEDSIFG
ncbi:hypothetical protein P7C70_g7209, partial [Phenoliferia sp. Uapishka_3]